MNQLPRWRVTFDVLEHYSEEVIVRAFSEEAAEDKARRALPGKRINPQIIIETADTERVI